MRELHATDEPCLKPGGAIRPADALALIAEHADLIGRGPDGRAFLLLDLSADEFETLALAGAEVEDLEPETDEEDDTEPSGDEHDDDGDLEPWFTPAVTSDLCPARQLRADGDPTITKHGASHVR